MHILVLDDRPDMLAAIARMLASAEHDFVLIDKPASQLSSMQAQEFDVLLTDIFMPGADGLEIIKGIRKVKPNLWIIAMSGGNEGASADDVLHQSARFGADRILSKPFRKAELIEALDACWDRHQPTPT